MLPPTGLGVHPPPYLFSLGEERACGFGERPAQGRMHLLEPVQELLRRRENGLCRTKEFSKSGRCSSWRGRAPQPGGPASPPPHQPSPGGSASATPPQGGSDTGTSCAGLKITPPLRGSRREGGARSRAGGGQTPPPVSEYQRHGQPRVGGTGLAPAPQMG